MEKVTSEQVKLYTLRKEIKEYHVRYCPTCSCTDRRFTIRDDGGVNIVTSCGCSPTHREYPTSWQKVADWLNGEEVI